MSGVLDGKSAIVTGAGSGVGRVSAVRFAQEGARVVVADINVDNAKETVREIESSGGTATAIGVVDPPVDPPAGPVDPPVDQPAPPTPAPPVTDGDVTVNPVVDAPPVVHPIPGLAVTGAQLTGIVASALGLLVAGGIALVVIRRRRPAADD